MSSKEFFTINKKRLFIALIVLAALFIIFLLGSIAITEQTWFCNSCHIMKPYYKGWQESAHKNVHCLDCHYEPNWRSHFMGKINGLMQVLEYMTGRYSEKPVATIKDESCLREGCHDKAELKDKKMMFKNKVEYSHSSHWKHLDDLGKDVELRCASCHSWLTYDKHMAVNENNCLICHFKNVSVEKISTQCLMCHTQIEKEGEHSQYIKEGMHCADCHTTVKTTNAPVLVQMCYFCHADPEKIGKIKDRELLHQKHIPQNNADCTNCHELIQHGKE